MSILRFDIMSRRLNEGYVLKQAFSSLVIIMILKKSEIICNVVFIVISLAIYDAIYFNVIFLFETKYHVVPSYIFSIIIFLF